MNGISLGQVHVEDDAADGGLDELLVELHDLGVHDVLIVELLGQVHEAAGDAAADRREQLDFAGLQRDDDFIEAAEDLARALGVRLGLGQVVAAENEILRRNGERLAVGRREDVVRGQHQHLRLDLSLRRERDVNGHLVAVEVGVEGRADERVDLDGLALDEHRLEGLDAETVERRRAVQEHRMLFDDALRARPTLRWSAARRAPWRP